MRSEDFGTKPSNTKIDIAKNGDFLEIYIPPVGLHPVFLFLACLCILWGGWILRIGFFTFSTPYESRFSTFSMVGISPFLLLDMMIGYGLLWVCFGKTYLRIDRHEISLTRFIFGVKLISRQKPAPKRNISKIVLTYRYYSYRTKEFIPAKLTFETDKQTIRLGGKGAAIEHQDKELEWLAYEVSEWLDKSLTTIGNSAN